MKVCDSGGGNTFKGIQLQMSCLQLTASWLQWYVRKGLCDGVANRRGFPEMGLPNSRGLDLIDLT